MSGTNNRPLRLAVVVPNYNHAAYLNKSLHSIAAQTRPADEIIVVDDCSTDDSVVIIEQFVAANSHSRLIKREVRGGVAAALNTGLASVTADAVAFLGADDELAAGFLEACGDNGLARWPCAGLASGCAYLALNGKRVGIRPIVRPTRQTRFVDAAEFTLLLRQADNFFLGTTTLYRTQPLRDLGGFEKALGALSDGLLLRRLAARHGFVFIPQVLGTWHLHGTNYSVTSSHNPEEVERLVGEARRVLAEEPDGIFEPSYARRLERRLRFSNARILAGERSLPTGLRRSRITGIAKLGSVFGLAVGALLRMGFPGQVAVITLLTLRLRPMSLWAVLRSRLATVPVSADDSYSDQERKPPDHADVGREDSMKSTSSDRSRS